jgi:PhnB protein
MRSAIANRRVDPRRSGSSQPMTRCPRMTAGASLRYTGADRMQFIPYLDFEGRCREAFDFYAGVFRSRITMRMTYGESPMAADLPADAHGRIMHSQLESAGGILMGADGPPHQIPTKGCVNLPTDTPAEAERIFAALADGGEVQMALQETFWAHRFGMLTDRYGKGWMVNCMKTPPAA